MPIFNKLSKKISDALKKKSINAKDSNYMPIKYKSSNKIDYICSIKNAAVYADCGFIFTKYGKLIKDNYIWSNIWIYV